MTIKNKKGGFALLIAVIFMSVMLAIGLTLGSIGYKQAVLAQNALESQYAFYAADGGLECALYAAQQQALFSYGLTQAPVFYCNGLAPYSSQPLGSAIINGESDTVFQYRFETDANTGILRCVDTWIYVPQTSTQTTYLFAQGYDTSCANVQNNGRFATRGIEAYY